MNIYLYDSDSCSVSIPAKTQKEADEILAANVIAPESFIASAGFNEDDINID